MCKKKKLSVILLSFVFAIYQSNATTTASVSEKSTNFKTELKRQNTSISLLETELVILKEEYKRQEQNITGLMNLSGILKNDVAITKNNRHYDTIMYSTGGFILGVLVGGLATYYLTRNL